MEFQINPDTIRIVVAIIASIALSVGIACLLFKTRDNRVGMSICCSIILLTISGVIVHERHESERIAAWRIKEAKESAFQTSRRDLRQQNRKRQVMAFMSSLPEPWGKFLYVLRDLDKEEAGLLLVERFVESEPPEISVEQYDKLLGWIERSSVPKNVGLLHQFVSVGFDEVELPEVVVGGMLWESRSEWWPKAANGGK